MQRNQTDSNSVHSARAAIALNRKSALSVPILRSGCGLLYCLGGTFAITSSRMRFQTSCL